tara:strand:- start:401 stop:544 length:144 start_codon:yes stop_codon:yes gene_type:complete
MNRFNQAEYLIASLLSSVILFSSWLYIYKYKKGLENQDLFFDEDNIL